MIPILRYPLNRIERETDYLAVRVVSFERSGLISPVSNPFNIPQASNAIRQAAQDEKNIQGVIYLPIPNGLVDRNSVKWDEGSLNPVAAAAFGATKDAVQGLNLNNITSNGMGAFKDVAEGLGDRLQAAGVAIQDPAVTDALRDYFIGNAVNTFNANVDGRELISRTTGQVLNPNLELLFQGVNLRNFNFNFPITVRSEKEGQQVKKIINTFKKRMAAKTNTGGNEASRGIFIKSPDVFEMEFRRGSDKHPFLFSMKPCALRNISVDYASGAPYMTYWDGTPVSMSMKLEFTEINPVYAEDYNELSDDDGVGF